MSDYKELRKAIGNTRYGQNHETQDYVCHPHRTVLSYAPPSDPVHAVDIFMERLEHVTDGELGDFKRRISSYLYDLQALISPMGFSFQKKLTDMQLELQFCQTKTEAMRQKLLTEARILRNWVVSKLATEQAERAERSRWKRISQIQPRPQSQVSQCEARVS